MRHEGELAARGIGVYNNVLISASRRSAAAAVGRPSKRAGRHFVARSAFWRRQTSLTNIYCRSRVHAVRIILSLLYMCVVILLCSAGIYYYKI